ncbi:MAG: hypothetical protein HWE39_05605 [Oceanospirillaceae bacterium]|nr:hypothetical protein [Oceanospirillaceae bacterium]
MRNLFLLIILLAGFVSTPARSYDSDIVTLPYDPANGDTFYYRIRKSDVTEGEKAKVKPVSLSDVSIEFLGLQEDGYIYKLSYLSMGPEDKNLAAIPAVKQALAMFEGLSFEYIADETGSPLAVRDLQKVKEWLLGPAFDLLEKTGSSKETMQQMRTFFGNMSAESTAELLLKDIGFIFMYTGTEFSMTEQYEAENRGVWNMTGTELVTHVRTEVVSVNDGLATLRTRSGYTRESVMHGIETLMAQMIPNMAPEKKDEMQAAFREMESFDLRQEFDAEVSIADGWPSQIKGVTVTDVGKAKRTITYEISRLSEGQALARAE